MLQTDPMLTANRALIEQRYPAALNQEEALRCGLMQTLDTAAEVKTFCSVAKVDFQDLTASAAALLAHGRLPNMARAMFSGVHGARDEFFAALAEAIPRNFGKDIVPCDPRTALQIAENMFRRAMINARPTEEAGFDSRDVVALTGAMIAQECLNWRIKAAVAKAASDPQLHEPLREFLPPLGPNR